MKINRFLLKTFILIFSSLFALRPFSLQQKKMMHGNIIDRLIWIWWMNKWLYLNNPHFKNISIDFVEATFYLSALLDIFGWETYWYWFQYENK